MSDTTAPLTIVEKLEQLGHEALTAVEHAAVRAVGFAAKAETSLKTLLADNVYVRDLWDAGVASANAHGIPVTAIEDIAGEILAAAEAFIASLTQPPPVPVPAAA